MKVIHVPHPTLRSTAQSITTITKKTKKQLDSLLETLKHHQDPPGVGLAAPQVNLQVRAFATYLPHNPGEERSHLQLFINPEVIDHADTTILGETPQSTEERLEGCLSIPYMYGAVPRWEWLQLRYFVITDDLQLAETTAVFHNFAARVIQHEYDHLDGILFTDHSIKHGLPIYTENQKTKKLEEIDPHDITF